MLTLSSPPPTTMAKKQSFLKRGLSKVIGLGLIGLGLSYVAVVSVVMIPMVQT